MRLWVKPRWVDAALFVGIWSAWAVFISGLVTYEEKIPFIYPLYCNLILFGIAALLSLPVMRFAGWFDRRRLNPLSTVFIIGTVCVSYAAAWIWISYLVFAGLFGQYFINIFDPRSGWIFLNGLIVCGVIFGITYARRYSRKLQEAELKRVELQYLAKESELCALRSQINPHFLFNSLNSVYAMIDADPAGAKDMLVKLSELLRLSLSTLKDEFVTFEEDWDFARRYLEIEKIRLGDRLQVETHISEKILTEMVPCLTLQPIVENAVKHGVSRSQVPVIVKISAEQNDSHIDIKVSDTGPGVPDSEIEGIQTRGHGLENLTSRLSKIYGEDYSISFKDKREGGFQVSISIPVRPREE